MRLCPNKYPFRNKMKCLCNLEKDCPCEFYNLIERNMQCPCGLTKTEIQKRLR